jgi:hypothetical protein
MISHIADINLIEIIVANQSLGASYAYINTIYCKNIPIKVMPSSKILQILILLKLVIKLKLNKQKLIIFHECCMPLFDLLIKIIKPTGYYVPQVTMRGYEKITLADFPRFERGITYWLIRLTGVHKLFQYYRSPSLANSGPQYVMSIKAYPRQVSHIANNYTDNIRRRNVQPNLCKLKSILLITSTFYGSDAKQVSLFIKIIEMAYAKGYACVVKDHPNPANRLNFKYKNVDQLDPLLPVELIPNSHDLVIGVGTTALLSFPNNAVSVLGLLPDLSDVERQLAIDHFQYLDINNTIKFVDSFSALDVLLG